MLRIPATASSSSTQSPYTPWMWLQGNRERNASGGHCSLVNAIGHSGVTVDPFCSMTSRGNYTISAGTTAIQYRPSLRASRASVTVPGAAK